MKKSFMALSLAIFFCCLTTSVSALSWASVLEIAADPFHHPLSISWTAQPGFKSKPCWVKAKLSNPER